MAPARTLGLTLILAGCAWIACSEDPPGEASYVGRATCVECHEAEHAAWRGSHHDLAMQEVSDDTVLGDFGDVEFEHFGLKSRFYKKGGKFMVRTDGPEGDQQDYPIRYVFGFDPLQQYLVEFPGGRLQTLGICWDARPIEKGGQRWFHVYHDEKITHDDPLHWTGRLQNWNFMCANCHSTNLRKNFDLETNGYHTTWAEIDVSCEACHGPASHHVEWAKSATRAGGSKGFAWSPRNRSVWTFESGAKTATRVGGVRVDPVAGHPQTGMCARCHSRRTTMREEPVRGQPLLDTHLPALLDPLLYHADGQILDEVYVYGSFLQSKMYAMGVTCTDCHDAHSQKLHLPGNALCTRCHDAMAFDSPAHHHHAIGSAGAACVECHMPTRRYMVVDPRRDHSIRIPRPDLSGRLGTPNACNACHADRSPQWATDAIAAWFGPDHKPRDHYVDAIHAGREGLPGAAAKLSKLASDTSRPGIVRATAVAMLEAFPDQASVAAVQSAVRDQDPIVRLGAVQALEGWPASVRKQLGAGLLEDPVRAVRVEAARVLAMIPAAEWSDHERHALAMALGEYQGYQLLNGGQPWAHTNLGIVFSEQRKPHAAEKAYRTAIRIDPSAVRAYANLADLYRGRQRDDLGEQVLRDGLRVGASAELRHALGLLLHRQKRMPEAVAALAKAASLRPDVARFGYAYALALNSSGKTDLALTVLRRAHTASPRDRDVLVALATFNRDRERWAVAVLWAKKLRAVAPGNPEVIELLRELERRRRGR